MTPLHLVSLLPLLTLIVVSVVVMLVVAFRRNHAFVAIATMTGLALAFATLPIVAWSNVPHQVTTLLVLDHFALFYMGLIFAATFAVAALSYSYFEKQDAEREELYILLLLAAVGSAVLVASTHFASLFLGLEILTVSLYGLIAYLRDRDHCIEAGVKYLILAAVSSSFLLFGMALIYAQFGTMEFTALARAASTSYWSLLLLTGLPLIIVGMGFKLALAPFHMWTPDVYEGAPAPVTAFIATVSKGAVFALLLRFFSLTDVRAYPSLFLLFTIIAIASMFIGNLLALQQRNVKRILAYSSISHLGYVTVAFLTGGEIGVRAATFYLVAYIITSLIAFGVITVLSGVGHDADEISDYRFLAWRHPWMGAFFTASLLSLAGIPLTAGFIGKFAVLSAGVGASLWLLAVVLIINSAIGLYYYLRIIVQVYAQPEKAEVRVKEIKTGGTQAAAILSRTGGIILAILTLLLLWIGIDPAPIFDLVRRAVSGGF